MFRRNIKTNKKEKPLEKEKPSEKEEILKTVKIYRPEADIKNIVDYEKSKYIWFSGTGQLNYLWASCPKCNSGIKYYDKRIIAYCSFCGQKVIWKYFKDKTYKMNEYEIIYTIRHVSDVYREIVEAVNMKEAIYNFYDQTINRFDILTVKLINNIKEEDKN